MPPNGWGCRCEAIQLPGSSYSETPDTQIPYTPITPMFQINFGKRSIAFPPSHPYYKRLPKEQEQLIENFTRQELRRVLDNYEQFKQLKNNDDYDKNSIHFNWVTGGLTAIHNEHNLKDDKISKETEIQKFLYKKGYSIILQSEKNDEGKPIADGLLNGMKIELATRYNGRNKTLKDGLNHCAKKKPEIALVNFPNGISKKEINSGLHAYYGLEGKDGYCEFQKIFIINKNTLIIKSGTKNKKKK